MLTLLPEMDCWLPARSVLVFTDQFEGMLKVVLDCEFHTMYFCPPLAGLTGHCQVPSWEFEQVIEEFSSQPCTWSKAMAAGVGVVKSGPTKSRCTQGPRSSQQNHTITLMPSAACRIMVRAVKAASSCCEGKVPKGPHPTSVSQISFPNWCAMARVGSYTSATVFSGFICVS